MTYRREGIWDRSGDTKGYTNTEDADDTKNTENA